PPSSTLFPYTTLFRSSVAFVVLFHFGKAGYVLSFLPAAVLLLLWPAAKLPRRALVGASLVVVAVAGVDAQRFLQAAGVLPAQALDRKSTRLNSSHVKI